MLAMNILVHFWVLNWAIGTSKLCIRTRTPSPKAQPAAPSSFGPQVATQVRVAMKRVVFRHYRGDMPPAAPINRSSAKNQSWNVDGMSIFFRSTFRAWFYCFWHMACPSNWPRPQKLLLFFGINESIMNHSFEVSASVLTEAQYRWS